MTYLPKGLPEPVTEPEQVTGVMPALDPEAPADTETSVDHTMALPVMAAAGAEVRGDESSAQAADDDEGDTDDAAIDGSAHIADGRAQVTLAARTIAGLYNNSRPQGMGIRHFVAGKMPPDEALSMARSSSLRS